MNAIQQRAPELEQVSQIITACRVEANHGPSAVGIGVQVGKFMAEASQRPPTNSTGHNNLRRSLQTPYTPGGYHIEGGLGLDMSFSAFFEYSRLCGGLEFGMGAEIGLVILSVEDIDPPLPNDASIFYDMDLAVGVATGVAIGSYQNAGKLLFEITIGAGFGGGAGFAYCLDTVYE